MGHSKPDPWNKIHNVKLRCVVFEHSDWLINFKQPIRTLHNFMLTFLHGIKSRALFLYFRLFKCSLPKIANIWVRSTGICWWLSPFETDICLNCLNSTKFKSSNWLGGPIIALNTNIIVDLLVLFHQLLLQKYFKICNGHLTSCYDWKTLPIRETYMLSAVV